MSARELVAIALVVVAFLLGLGEHRRGSAAESFAEQRDSVASEALDSAAVWREGLERIEAEYADSLDAYGVREVERVREEAVDSLVRETAVEAAQEAADRVVALADSATVAAFTIYRTERDAEVAVERRGRLRAEERVASLGVQVSQLTAGLTASRAETADVRVAYQAIKAAEDALAAELAGRGEPWYWKAATAVSVVCLFLCG